MKNFSVRLSASRLYFLLTIPFAIYFCLTYRPARDDWNNWANLRDIPLTVSSFPEVVLNQWCCGHEKRTFFLSWMIQWPLTHIAEHTETLMGVLLATVLLTNGLLALHLSQSVLPKFHAVLLGLFVALGPGTVIVGGWANNLFFILPILFAQLFVLANLSQRFRKPPILLLLSLASVFSGETGVFAILSGALLLFLFRRQRKMERQLIFVLLATVVVLLTHRHFAAGPSTQIKYDPVLLVSYLKTYFWQEFRIWMPFSWLYRPNINFMFLIISFGAAALLLSTRPFNQSLSFNGKDIRAKLVLPTILFLFVSALLAPLTGAITGVRLGPEFRYHYFSYCVASLIFVYLIARAPKTIRLLGTAFLSAFLFYGSMQSLTVRANQAGLDQQLWTNIETIMKPDDKYIVTFAPDRNYPMPAYYSFAESDFQADWGISGYLRWTSQKRFQVYAKLKCEFDTCKGSGYYGLEDLLSQDAQFKTIFIYTSLRQSPDDLSISDFTISRNYIDYLEFTNLHGD